MLLRNINFGGLAPRVNPTLLPHHRAQIASNCRLLSGKLEAWYGLQSTYALVGAPPVKTIYKMADTYWLESGSDVNFVKGPINADTTEVTLFTGTDRPRITDLTLANTGGAVPYPKDSLYLGLPVPVVSGSIATLVPSAGVISAATVNWQESLSTSLAYTAVTGVDVTIDVNFSVEWGGATTQDPGTVTVVLERNGIPIAEKTEALNTRGTPNEPLDTHQKMVIHAVDSPPSGANTYALNVTYNGQATGAASEEYRIAARYSNQVSLTVTNVGTIDVGERITIAGVVGMTALNGTWEVLSKSGNDLRVGCATLETYTSGGTWTEVYEEEEKETRYYVVTYTTVLGGQTMEGPPSAPFPTDGVICGIEEQVDLSVLPGAPAGDYSVSKLRIYRTAVGLGGEAEFQYVGENNIGTLTFSDTVDVADLGEVLPSEGWIEPPTTMTGIIATNDGVVIGFYKNQIYPSEPFQVHAYPIKYRKTLHRNVVGLATVGIYGIAILTDGEPYVMAGRHPDDYSLERIEMIEPCLSKRGIVDMGFAAIYPSPNGLAAVGPGRLEVVTRALMTSREWADFYPSTIVAARYADSYVGFYDNGAGITGGFVYDTKEGEFTKLALTVSGAWTDPKTGHLYLAIGGNIQKFDADSTAPLTYTWRSKLFTADVPKVMSVARVRASAYPVTFSLYAQVDGAMTKVHQQTVTNERPFRLTSTAQYRSNRFEFEVTGTKRVEGVDVGESMSDMMTLT